MLELQNPGRTLSIFDNQAISPAAWDWKTLHMNIHGPLKMLRPIEITIVDGRGDADRARF